MIQFSQLPCHYRITEMYEFQLHKIGVRAAVAAVTSVNAVDFVFDSDMVAELGNDESENYRLLDGDVLLKASELDNGHITRNFTFQVRKQRKSKFSAVIRFVCLNLSFIARNRFVSSVFSRIYPASVGFAITIYRWIVWKLASLERTMPYFFA